MKEIKTAKHTPGPWTISKDGRIVAPLIGAKIWEQQQTKHIATVPFGADALTPVTAGSERAANARLIAAAPELLAALENVLNEFVHVPGDTKGNKARTVAAGIIGGPNAALARAREAIAKAKGE